MFCVLGRPSFQDVVSSRHWAGKLGMGRAGDSFDDEFPQRSGARTPRRHDPLVGRKRGGPWVRWLLLLLFNLLISLKIIIVEPGGPRPAVFAWDLCTFQQL